MSEACWCQAASGAVGENATHRSTCPTQPGMHHPINSSMLAYANGLDVERADLTLYGVVNGRYTMFQRFDEWARKHADAIAACEGDGTRTAR